MVDAARSKMLHIALGFKVVNHVIVGGKRTPGLNANEGSLALGGVPDAQIVHIGVLNTDRAVVLAVAKGDRLTHIGKNYSIVVKQMMLEGKYCAIFKGIGFFLVGDIAGGTHNDILNALYAVKFKIVILKYGAVLSKGHVKAGVTADAEDELLGVGIFYAEVGDHA